MLAVSVFLVCYAVYDGSVLNDGCDRKISHLRTYGTMYLSMFFVFATCLVFARERKWRYKNAGTIRQLVYVIALFSSSFLLFLFLFIVSLIVLPMLGVPLFYIRECVV